MLLVGGMVDDEKEKAEAKKAREKDALGRSQIRVYLYINPNQDLQLRAE